MKVSKKSRVDQPGTIRSVGDNIQIEILTNLKDISEINNDLLIITIHVCNTSQETR